MKFSKKFRASLDSLKAIRQFIIDCLKDHPAAEDDKDQIILAVDEAATNVIKHALKFDANRLFTVEVKSDSGQIEIIIIDDGPPFDADKIPEKPDVGQRIKEKKRGGLGIYLMRNVMDEVIFDRKNGFNRTIMRKNCRV